MVRRMNKYTRPDKKYNRRPYGDRPMIIGGMMAIAVVCWLFWQAVEFIASLFRDL